jgi:hypothetical protein
MISKFVDLVQAGDLSNAMHFLHLLDDPLLPPPSITRADSRAAADIFLRFIRCPTSTLVFFKAVKPFFENVDERSAESCLNVYGAKRDAAVVIKKIDGRDTDLFLVSWLFIGIHFKILPSILDVEFDETVDPTSSPVFHWCAEP